VEEGVFYVRRHTCTDGSFEWYVLNGHTLRRASKFFPPARKPDGAGRAVDSAYYRGRISPR
jgi:hypothetical protein